MNNNINIKIEFSESYINYSKEYDKLSSFLF